MFEFGPAVELPCPVAPPATPVPVEVAFAELLVVEFAVPVAPPTGTPVPVELHVCVSVILIDLYQYATYFALALEVLLAEDAEDAELTAELLCPCTSNGPK